VGSITELRWRKATRSGANGGNCVEVGSASGDPDVHIRDSKSRERGTLTVTDATWRTFTDSIKAGQLDLPR
jgi:hypothetical protein